MYIINLAEDAYADLNAIGILGEWLIDLINFETLLRWFTL
jgi:hypothetical protein